MSLAVIIVVQEGVALSADSRGLREVAGKWELLSDGDFKVHWLWKRVGVAHVGDGHVDGLPIATLIAQYENSTPAPNRVEEAARGLLAYLRSKSPVTNTHVFVAGVEQVPVAFKIATAADTCVRIGVDADGDPCRWLEHTGGRPSVEGAMLQSLKAACPPSLNSMSLKDAVDYSRHLIRTVIDQTRFGSEMPVVGGPIDTLVLTAQGGCWMSRKVV